MRLLLEVAVHEPQRLPGLIRRRPYTAEREDHTMNKPILVVMAAGMGSRYGGLKQMDPVGNHGQLILDYSIYDARRAGFETVVFVIKRELEEAFRAAIGGRLSRRMEVTIFPSTSVPM